MRGPGSTRTPGRFLDESGTRQETINFMPRSLGEGSSTDSRWSVTRQTETAGDHLLVCLACGSAQGSAISRRYAGGRCEKQLHEHQMPLKRLNWGSNCHPIRSILCSSALVSARSIRRTAVERRELGTIKELVNRPQGEVLTHYEPQMNMSQGGDGHLNQAVVLRIELNEGVAVEEDSTEAESWHPLPYPYSALVMRVDGGALPCII